MITSILAAGDPTAHILPHDLFHVGPIIVTNHMLMATVAALLMLLIFPKLFRNAASGEPPFASQSSSPLPKVAPGASEPAKACAAAARVAYGTSGADATGDSSFCAVSRSWFAASCALASSRRASASQGTALTRAVRNSNASRG